MAAARPGAVSRRFADLYLHAATLIALAPALMVAVGWTGAKFGLLSAEFGLGVMAYQWAPHVASASVAAGIFGVIVALMAGFSRFWVRALLVIVITTLTLLAYVWERQAQPWAPALSHSSTAMVHELA